jgi:hypothetical protein
MNKSPVLASLTPPPQLNSRAPGIGLHLGRRLENGFDLPEHAVGLAERRAGRGLIGGIRTSVALLCVLLTTLGATSARADGVVETAGDVLQLMPAIVGFGLTYYYGPDDPRAERRHCSDADAKLDRHLTQAIPLNEPPYHLAAQCFNRTFLATNCPTNSET